MNLAVTTQRALGHSCFPVPSVSLDDESYVRILGITILRAQPLYLISNPCCLLGSLENVGQS